MSDTQTSQLPAKADTSDMMALVGGASSPALQIILNDRLYERCKDVATKMSRAEGVTPKHLLGKPEACFAVVQMAIIWKLAPQMVAGATYATPSGNIGYEGKLCHAILENSGRVEGQIKAVYYGPWEKIVGKFKIEQSRNQYGKDVKLPKQIWTDDDEEGVGVTVIAQVKGEVEPRTMDFDLKSAHPRNSTIWVTRTKQQLWYTAIRAFGNMAMPGIFMGVPFEGDDFGAGMVDVTPADQRPAARPNKPAAAATRAASTAMDQEFKDTVTETVIEHEPDAPAAATAQATEPTPTVVEETMDEQSVDQQPDEVHDQGGDDAQENQDQAPRPSPPAEQAEEAPAARQAQPAKSTKAPEAKATDAPVAEGNGGLPPFTEKEAREFRNTTEKAVLNCTSTMSVDSLKQKISRDFRRLKAFSPEISAKLLATITGKETYLREKEEREG